MSESQSSYKHTNRLINETSPYLLQHAHNPVDWYPWGDDAFAKARQEDKPILLSVGYSACHWCHVMERESFENEQIAALMNMHFVSIKVDREERPDIDAIYMQAVQAMTGQGGWPMTMFLMPDGRPFYGGTYYPPQDRRYGQQVMPGFPRVLMSIADTFAHQRPELEEQATQVAEHLNRRGGVLARIDKAAGSPVLDSLLNAEQHLIEDFDARYGGFGGAPKFPNTMALEFLLRMHLHHQSGQVDVPAGEQLPTALEVVETSLQRMAAGGIYDQLGGGFHRYSVDEKWLVPHFEKMLYDNALLSQLYLHAYLVTGNELYRRVVEETLDYVVREMTAPEGGFYSTQDADSEGVEGKFFLWSQEEIERALAPQDAALFMAYYGVSRHGNFEGKNILNRVQDEQVAAQKAQLDLAALRESLQRSRSTLFRLREQRIKPARDEKVLTSWNGLMLRSFAEAARYLQRADYLQIAERNADFLLTTLRHDGRLLRTFKDGRARLQGYLEDYAFLADGLLALYEASFDTRWFVEARTLMDQAIQLFADEQGGFFDTGIDHETLISRPKDIMDNATPAGNSVAADVLLHLAAFTGEDTYRQRADDYLQPLAEIMVQHPQAFGHVLCAVDFALSPVKELAVLGTAQNADTQELLACINARYLPQSVLACAQPEDQQASTVIPLLADRPLKDQHATAYVCQNFACQAPVTTPAALAALL
ncbi:thioredoxin domain-containing protein [Dictyobacter kobayashii]|uniref:Thioredoxin domain-containing protein n=1 Tax=Dictyobacter kobayashii TaxID=2014872 RepID=A0A402AK56_9CHLR|nr:thioredoxin domain-containing protein [Dictyobacter kobayashii]GCE19517.1 thioredoxin domain-containing protein [Dictyobacter kobayashii]